jgi:hypothetical protein
MMIDGIAVRVILKNEGDVTRMLRINSEGFNEWHEIDSSSGMSVGATLSLPNDAARALLEALLRHYEGASDMHTVRADLLHERGRVDKMVDAIVRLNQSASDLAEKAIEALGTG